MHYKFFTIGQLRETIRITETNMNAILRNGGTAEDVKGHRDVISQATAELEARKS
jgi:hypothetical protein